MGDEGSKADMGAVIVDAKQLFPDGYSRRKTDKPASDMISFGIKNPVIIHESSGGSAQAFRCSKYVWRLGLCHVQAETERINRPRIP